jgi:hypothetical protein
LQVRIWFTVFNAVRVVSKVLPVHVSIEIVPATGDTYRKNTSAPSSKHDVALEVVAQSVEKKVNPSNRGKADSTLSFAGGIQTGIVVPGAVDGAKVGKVTVVGG